MDNRRAWLIALVWAGSTIACGGSTEISFTRAMPGDGGVDASGSGGASSGNGGGTATGGRAVGGSSGAGGTTSGGATSNGGNAGAGGVSSGGANTNGGAGGAAGAGGSNAGGSAGAGTNTGGAAGAGGANPGGTAGAGGANAGGTAGAGGVNTGGSAGAGGTNTGGAAGAGGADGGVLGTYVSSIRGDDSNPGTQALPVQTIAKGIANAITIGTGPVFVAEGNYPEKVTLVEGIDLSGGYQCDTTFCNWSRNTTANDTAIFNQDAEGVLADDTITRATLISGFRIMGLNGGATAGRGRAAITLRGGSPSIVDNRIFGPVTSGTTGPQGRSIAILVLSPSNSTEGAYIQNNTITANTAADMSIGISFESSGPGTGTAAASVTNNVIRGGPGANSAAINAGNSSAATLVGGNEIMTGSATAGGAWAIQVSSQMTIDSNRINVNYGNVACRTANPCGGINSLSSTTTITNNVIFGADATNSIGVRLMEAEKPSGVVVLNSNTIDGGGTSSGNSTSAALRVEIGPCPTCGFNGFVGHIRNNILMGGVADERFAVYEEAPSGRTQHPDILENNDLYISAPGGSDALYRYFDGNNQTLLTSVTNVNNLQNRVASMTVGSNISADPLLDSRFNLMSGSNCIDVGTSAEAPIDDKNNQARPQNGMFDIGADEF
jgi:hypothetical protein